MSFSFFPFFFFFFFFFFLNLKTAHSSNIFILLYTHLPYDNDSIIKQTQGQRRKKEDFFTNIFTSHFIARVRKGCSRFACEKVLETKHKLHILTPLLWPSRCVFLILLMLGSTPSGLSEGPLGRVWPSLPHLVSGCLEFY